MKKLTHPLLVLGTLLCTLSGTALADTATGASVVQTCPLVGQLDSVTEECRAYRAALAVCMDQMQQEADARAGHPIQVNSQINRARVFTCDAETREQLGLVKK